MFLAILSHYGLRGTQGSGDDKLGRDGIDAANL